MLFLCRANTTSSIMAEALLGHHAPDRFRAGSAGDALLRGQVNPHALQVLRVHGVPTQGLRSKAWREFFGMHREAFATLEARIRKLAALPLARLTNRGLARELKLIGQEP